MTQECSPLQRAAEQPPCDSNAEALCLVGMFAVPERMAHFDLTPYLVFVEHRAIWRSMKRAIAGDPDGFWWRTFVDLEREQPAAQVLAVLEWSPQWTVNDSDEGCLVFMLAFAKIRRCAEARRRIQGYQEAAERDWRVPDRPYSLEEKRLLLGDARPIRIDV